ncbi:phosphotransferase family protein [Pseudonocardia halophobica]|uniref:phosphotransferase family protein n=1 Tax=Pseudonocardia halophobica TaxID=29401 RepID=UPI003D8DD927
MTGLAAARVLGPLWPQLLPAERQFVALPSRHRPVIVADRDPQVLRYVRTALLATPPGSSLPTWAYSLAGQALRVPGTSRLLPRHHRQLDVAETDLQDIAALVRTHDNRLVVLQHSHDPDARCVLLLFEPGSAVPDRVVKLAAGAAAADRMEREARALELLQGLSDRQLGAQVPRLLALRPHHERPALMTTALPGVPMLVRYHRSGHTADRGAVTRDFQRAAGWLARLHAATARESRPLDLAPATLEAVESASTSPAASGFDLVEEAAALQVRLRRRRAPAALVHGDFWPGNLLTDGAQITGVVDWERSVGSGSPLRDHARFALCYSQYLDRHTAPGRRVRGHRGLVAGAPGGGVGYALDGNGWYPDLVRGFLRSVLARLHLPPECGRDGVLAEILAVAAEATEPTFAASQLALFQMLSEDLR